jgi:hypothetical protein
MYNKTLDIKPQKKYQRRAIGDKMRTKTRYRFTGNDLIQTLEQWEHLLTFRVHLIACGGTALTLLGIKQSTKDADFVVPIRRECERLKAFLVKLGYSERGGGLSHSEQPFFLFQFWPGNRVFTTDLLHSPLEPERHIVLRKWRHVYLGALSLIDLIITKMMRGTGTDVNDSIAAFATGQVDAEMLLQEYLEAARYDLNPDKAMRNFVRLTQKLHTEGLVNDQFLERVRAVV